MRGRLARGAGEDEFAARRIGDVGVAVKNDRRGAVVGDGDGRIAVGRRRTRALDRIGVDLDDAAGRVEIAEDDRLLRRARRIDALLQDSTYSGIEGLPDKVIDVEFVGRRGVGGLAGGDVQRIGITAAERRRIVEDRHRGAADEGDGRDRQRAVTAFRAVDGDDLVVIIARRHRAIEGHHAARRTGRIFGIGGDRNQAQLIAMRRAARRNVRRAMIGAKHDAGAAVDDRILVDAHRRIAGDVGVGVGDRNSDERANIAFRVGIDRQRGLAKVRAHGIEAGGDVDFPDRENRRVVDVHRLIGGDRR